MNLCKPNSSTSLFMAAVMSLMACSSTKLTQTWSDPEFKGSYDNIMIVGVAQSEQTRRAYESYFAEELRKRGMKALASYKVIDHKTELELGLEKSSFRDIVDNAVAGSDIDAVLITHVVAVEEENVYRPSMDYQPYYGPAYGPAYYSTGYYGNVYGYHGYVTTYVQQPGYYTLEKTYVLESSLFDVKTQELVWSTRSRTFAPESIDQAIEELTALIIDDLADRKIIR